MSRRLIIVLALLFVAGMTCAAYAEVQNVKVSGDLLFMAVDRNQFDLERGAKGDKINDNESFLSSQIRLRVDADLTDNVSTTIRLISERSWDSETNASSDVDVDLAYVTLKEFLYSPLSITVGRQELRYGNGLIIGASGTYSSGVLNGIPSDLSIRKSFDAAKATLNYDPLTVDFIYAKIDRGMSGDDYIKRSRDVDLYGVYASYDFGRKGLKADLYFFDKRDKSHIDTSSTGPRKGDDIETLGALVSATPIENLKTSLEIANQFGNISYDNSGKHKQRAWAGQFMADYTFPKVKYTPAIGMSYTYLSGDGKSDGNKDKEWNVMYYDQALNGITYALLPFTNMQVWNVKGSMKPMDDITVLANVGFYGLNKYRSSMSSAKFDGNGDYQSYTMNPEKKHLGTAVDLTGIYDYTEDVQLGLTFGYFKPGDAFTGCNNDPATQFIGSMKVTF